MAKGVSCYVKRDKVEKTVQKMERKTLAVKVPIIIMRGLGTILIGK